MKGEEVYLVFRDGGYDDGLSVLGVFASRHDEDLCVLDYTKDHLEMYPNGDAFPFDGSSRYFYKAWTVK